MRTRRKGRWLPKQPRLGARMCLGTFFFISYQKAFDARGDCRQQVLRIGMSEHLTSIH